MVVRRTPIALLAAVSALGCSQVLDLNSYSPRPSAADRGDAAAEGGPLPRCATEAKASCSCTMGDTCDQSCLNGGCAFRCAAGSTCSATCAGGGCMFICESGATCLASCAGGGCSFVCEVGAMCQSSCTGGGCT